MVKRREPPVATSSKIPTAEAIEAFASGADGGQQAVRQLLDPSANRALKLSVFRLINMNLKN